MENKESVLVYGKLNNVVRTIVRDIIFIFKENRNGFFVLPEDRNLETLTYDFPQLKLNFSIELELKQSNDVKTFETDGEYFPEEDTIKIYIMSNQKTKNEILKELTSELNELVRHELEHVKQHLKGLKLFKSTKNSKKYYTQSHELEAQYKGFKRRSIQEKIDFEKVVRNWFEKYQHKHSLKPKQKEFVIDRILSKSF